MAVSVPIASIKVAAARRKTLHPDTVRAIAADIEANGLQVPLKVRVDGQKYRLVEGLHRLEALKWLGETDVMVEIADA